MIFSLLLLSRRGFFYIAGFARLKIWGSRVSKREAFSKLAIPALYAPEGSDLR
jgi:hypothetical protein